MSLHLDIRLMLGWMVNEKRVRGLEAGGNNDSNFHAGPQGSTMWIHKPQLTQPFGGRRLITEMRDTTASTRSDCWINTWIMDAKCLDCFLYHRVILCIAHNRLVKYWKKEEGRSRRGRGRKSEWRNEQARGESSINADHCYCQVFNSFIPPLKRISTVWLIWNWSPLFLICWWWNCSKWENGQMSAWTRDFSGK